MSEKNTPRAISAEQARHHCDPRELGFSSTAQCAELDGALGQQRATEALEFGSRVDAPGFNLFVLGRSGSLRHEIVQGFLKTKALGEPSPGDLCYVNNFQDERKPRKLMLPAGLGVQFRRDIDRLVEDLQAAIPAAFESDNYRSKLEELQQEFQDRHKQALAQIGEDAEKKGLALMPTPNGFAIAPVRHGQVISEEEFDKLPEEKRRETQSAIEHLTEKLKKHLETLPGWHKERREKTHELDKNIIMLSVGGLIQDLRKRYAKFPGVTAYLDAMEADVLDHGQQFRASHGTTPGLLSTGLEPEPPTHRYAVNLMVENKPGIGAPVIYESMPSHQALVGKIEHRVEYGNLVTDLRLVRAGALHRANGGYLIVDAERLLTQPMAWGSLKRALFREKIVIESAAEMLSLVSTQGLEPEPVNLKLKVVLIGDRQLYYLLSEFDPDFRGLFKVAADFEDQISRTPENIGLYGQMIAALIKRRDLGVFSAGAVACVIDQSARYAGDAEKLSTQMRDISDLLCEADQQRRQRKGRQVSEEDIKAAVRAARKREDRLYQNALEAILRSDVLIDTAGAKIAQINGLSVFRLGDSGFGLPSRITATVRLGEGDVLDIERESELGGAIHSKGVMILAAFLGSRYGRMWPLSMSASLVFEQNYGGVEGDSASAAELCVLLSAIAGLPLRQDLAITGSINQLGDLQAVGGINEKIEGFFDLCQRRGLTGSQGVLIPRASLKRLMLKDEVVDAIARGDFHVYPVDHVDQAASMLSGLPSADPDEHGDYSADTLQGRVTRALDEFRAHTLEFARRQKAPEEPDSQVKTEPAE
jgi:lon-related putative ATP-dependent protease